MSTIPLASLREAVGVHAISVDEYDQFIQKGIVLEGSPIELLDGMLVLKDRSKAGENIMTVGREHMWGIKAVGEIDAILKPLGYHMQSQSPVILSSYGEPEPDGAILLGRKELYVRRKPTAADVTCVIEVSDSSLNFDRTTKQRAYAEAKIPQYIILNLQDHVVEEYTQPDPATGTYAPCRVLRPGDTLELFLRGEERLSIRADEWILSV